MSAWEYGVNNNETVKLWSRKLFLESIKSTMVKEWMGEGPDNPIQIKTDLTKSEGDRVRNILLMQLSGAGVQGDATLHGSEESPQTYTDDLVINQTRHAVLSGGRMTQQRVPFSIRQNAMMLLKDWWTVRIETSVINQLTGNTAETDTNKTGNNSVTAPDSAHRIFAGSATAESNLSANSSQTFSLQMIDRAVLKARTLSPVIKPPYVMLITPEMHYDLRRNSATNDYADLQKSRIQGGEKDSNFLFEGGEYIGIYNGVKVYSSFYLPLITTADGANKGGRGVIFGRQAACIAFGSGNGADKTTWVEEMFDYENQLGVAGGMVYGCKKSIFNSKDFATIAHSAAHSTDAVAASGR